MTTMITCLFLERGADFRGIALALCSLQAHIYLYKKVLFKLTTLFSCIKTELHEYYIYNIFVISLFVFIRI